MQMLDMLSPSYTRILMSNSHGLCAIFTVHIYNLEYIRKFFNYFFVFSRLSIDPVIVLLAYLLKCIYTNITICIVKLSQYAEHAKMSVHSCYYVLSMRTLSKLQQQVTCQLDQVPQNIFAI